MNETSLFVHEVHGHRFASWSFIHSSSSSSLIIIYIYILFFRGFCGPKKGHFGTGKHSTACTNERTHSTHARNGRTHSTNNTTRHDTTCTVHTHRTFFTLSWYILSLPWFLHWPHAWPIHRATEDGRPFGFHGLWWSIACYSGPIVMLRRQYVQIYHSQNYSWCS